MDRLTQRVASTLCLSRSPERSALSKQGMSLHTEWTTRTDPAICFGLSEEAMDSSYWSIHGQAIILTWKLFFFCCIAERAIKPCRSSRSKLRGEFGIPRHLQNRNQKHNKATNKQNTKQTKDKNRQVLECETRGEKRVKRPKRPNALICRTPGGSMRYP